MGDPIEYESIRQTFGGAHRTQELFFGSVKDNIGHAEAASGVAGVLKTILMMQNRMIPKQANFSSLNPSISLPKRDRMTIAKQTQPWTAERLIALINNYGAAGSNAAILLHEHSISNVEVDLNAPPASTNQPEFPIFVSAKSPESLRSYCGALKSLIARAQENDANAALAKIAYNLAYKQNRAFECSWISTAPNLITLSEKLESEATRLTNVHEQPNRERPVILCFGGQTGRTISLSEDLFNNCTILRTHLVRLLSFWAQLSLFPS